MYPHTPRPTLTASPCPSTTLFRSRHGVDLCDHCIRDQIAGARYDLFHRWRARKTATRMPIKLIQARQLGMHVVQQLLAAHAQLRSPVATPVGDRVAPIQLDPAFLHALHDAVGAEPMRARLRDALLGLG